MAYKKKIAFIHCHTIQSHQYTLAEASYSQCIMHNVSSEDASFKF